MATQFFQGTFSNADPGAIIAVFDSCFSGHAYWSTYDAAAGPNCKVYRCYDVSVGLDFYLYVNNNYTGYAIIEGWTGWDADIHAGVGFRMYYMGTNTSYVYRIWCYSGIEWHLTLADYNFHFGHNHGHYIVGGVDEVLSDMYPIWPVIFVVRGTNTGLINPAGFGKYYSDYCDTCFLYTHEGIRVGGGINWQTAAVQPDGTVSFIDRATVYETTTTKAVGFIYNYACFGTRTNSERILKDGDTVTVDGETWLCFRQSTSDYGASLMRIS